MARLKLLLYALPILALVAAHLLFVTPEVAAQAPEAALAAAKAGAVAASRALAHATVEQQLAVQGTLIKALTGPSMGGATRGRADPVTPDRWTDVKDVVEYTLPEEHKANFYVGVAGYSTSLWGKVGEEPGPFPEGVTLPEGGGTALARLGGQLVQLVTVPSVPLTITAGLPLSGDPFAGLEAKSFGVEALAFVEGGKVIASSGAAEALALAQKAPAAGSAGVVETGAVDRLGPLQLPLFNTRDQLQGGSSPLAVAAREEVPGTAVEVVTLVRSSAIPTALAKYQRLALLALAGLLVWTLLWVALMGSGRARASPASAEPELAPAPPPEPALGDQTTRMQPVAPAIAPIPQAAPPPPKPVPEAVPEPPPPRRAPPAAAPAVSPADDFSNGFGRAPSGPPPSLFDDSPPIVGKPIAPVAAPVAAPPPIRPASPPVRPVVPPAAQPWGGGSDVETTRAYPTAPSSLFGGVGPSSLESPETTRVSPIPHDLLQAASARPSSSFGGMEAIPLPGTGAPPEEATRMSSTAQNLGAEEAHFQEVFREFVATRERCGEPADGLTYDKFVLKLKKNRDQLVEKYGAKSVRFQVYVKDGKAALKATPIK